MKAWTLGFIFSADLKDVFLIRKNRPEWQAGKLNGIGGSKLPDESFTACMMRESYEETGIKGTDDDWSLFACMQGPDWICHVYYTRLNPSSKTPETKTDEEIVRVRISDLENHATDIDLPMLIHAALVHHKRQMPGRSFWLNVKYDK